MDKKSKILLTALLIITVAFISYTSYKILVKQDFQVVNIEPAEEEGEDASLDAVGAGDEESYLPEKLKKKKADKWDIIVPCNNGFALRTF